MTDGAPAGGQAPSLADIDALARTAFAELPAPFRRLCEGLVIQVVDFPDEATLDEMGAQSEFDLLGLFRGRGLPQRPAVAETGAMPNMIWLYRRPLLDFWCEGEDTLGAVVRHVLVHEIGHHVGLSDDDMEAIERGGLNPKACRPSQGRHRGYRLWRRPDSRRFARHRGERSAF